MVAVCYECIEDSLLKDRIEEEGELRLCAQCGGYELPAIEVDDLGKWIEPVLKENFEPGQDIKRFGENDTESWVQEGDALIDILREVIGNDLVCMDKVLDAVIRAENARPQDGDYGLWDRTSNYVLKRVQIGYLVEEWKAASEQIRHRTRFYSHSTLKIFGSVFLGLENLRALVDDSWEPVVYEMPEGTRLYRARVCMSSAEMKVFKSDPMTHVGPPPSELARAGRMNAEGIVVFYGATDEETCFSELRPALGMWSASIQLETTSMLRMLDFNKLEKARNLESLSYFQSDFRSNLEVRKFLRVLHSLISAPVIPGRETEYLITQVMAEYLAYMMQPRIDGIMYKSAQREGGVNVVLFPKEEALERSFNIRYVPESMRFSITRAINYTHEELHVFESEDGEHIVFTGFDDFDDD